MRFDAHNNLICGDGDRLVAYLYDELPAAERSRFETHLADCSTCVDEFAHIANSRFEVFDWRRLEFDPLETPQFLVPYGERAQKTAPAVGWIASLKELFALKPGFAAAGAFASLALVLGIGYFALIGGSSDGYLAVNPPAEINKSSQPVSGDARINNETAVTANEFESRTAQNGEQEHSSTIDAGGPKISAPAPAPRSTRPVATRTANRTVTDIPAAEPGQTALRLSDLDDVADDSLRLVDLFDDIGTSD